MRSSVANIFSASTPLRIASVTALITRPPWVVVVVVLEASSRRARLTSALLRKFRSARWRDLRTREERGGGGARRLAGDPQLRVDVREVPLHGASAQEQPLRDLLVAHPGGHKLEHLALAIAQLGYVRSRGERSLVVAQEGVHLSEKHVPGRLAVLEDVVVRFERHEASVRKQGCQPPSLLVGHGPIVSRVKNQRRL